MTKGLPPFFNSETPAPKPTVVKNAIISGLCSVVSNVNSVTSRDLAAQATSAISNPPSTAAGMLSRASTGNSARSP
jgi:hypothetical protein